MIKKLIRFWTGMVENSFSKETATINIEGNNVRFLVTQGKRVKRWESVSLSSGLVKEGLILNPEIVSASISEMIASRGLKKGKVIASLSGIQSVYRIVDLPKMPRKILGEAILGEAKKAMSISLEKTYLSWHSISGKKEAMQRFLLLGVPKNIMDAEIQCLHKAGLNPSSMHLKPVALARMIARTEAWIIDIEPDNCSIIAISGGVPIIMRSVVMSMGNSLSERGQHILQEFKRTLQFYETSYPDKPHDPCALFLTGGLAGETELRQTIESGTGYTIQALESLPGFPPGFPVAQFAVNIGLAVKGTAPTACTSNFDILPEVFRPRSFPVKKAVYAAAVMAAIALVIPLYQLANGATSAASQSQTEMNILNKDIALRQTQNKEAAQINGSIALVKSKQQNLQEILSNIQKLQDRRSQAYELLYVSAVSILPNNVSLNSIKEEEGLQNLAGQADSYEAALGYADALRKVEGFSEVQVHSLTRVSEAGEAVSFVISLNWN